MKLSGKAIMLKNLLYIFLFNTISISFVQSQGKAIYINEILASNLQSDYDAVSGGYPDWLELFNSGSLPVNIGGYYLTSDAGNIKMWRIPDGAVIQPNGYFSFWADESGVTNHTNFTLDREGGFVGLFNSSGAVIDSFSYGFQARDVSYGRSIIASEKLVYFSKPTMGRANSDQSFSSFSESPAFSLNGGFYVGSQTVILTSPSPDAVIYYTTNGMEPDTSSQVYSLPIKLSKTTALRARAFEKDALPSLTITRTYLIGENINLPVISIVTDSANFFDDSIGIYITGKNGIRGSCDSKIRNLNQDWERAVNIEFYEKNGTLAFNQEAGVKIFGGCSRTRFPQKSLAIYARKNYGKGSFDYRIFPDKNIYKFESFVLRSSADDQVRTFMRDALAQYIGIGDMDIDYQAYRPAVVYFDGVYWGIHDIREKLNEHYLESNYNVESSSVNILQSNYSVVYGESAGYSSLISFLSSASLDNNSNYNFIKSKIDIDQFIDYEILHIYLAERDWPGNNIKYWNSSIPGHTKWRWICFDLDQTFMRTTANTLADATATNGPTWPNPPWATLLLRNLLSNTEFRNRFIQRYAFYTGTTFKPVRLDSIVNVFKSTLEPEIPRHIKKWGGLKDMDSQETWMPPTFSSLEQWQSNVNSLKAFIKDRPSVAMDHLRNKFGLKGMVTLKISSNIEGGGDILLYDRKIPNPVYNGSHFPDVPVLLRALSNPGFRFLRWELSGSVTRTDYLSEIYVTFNATQEVKAVYEKIEITFPSIIINEINYNSSPGFETGDWIEIYNRQSSPVNISGWKIRDSNFENEYVFPQGTVLPANGYIVACEDIRLLLTGFHYLINYRGNTGFGLKNEEEVVKLINSKNDIIDSVHYLNNSPWPDLPDGKGYSLILKSPDLDNDIPENWTAGLKGTPGAVNGDFTGFNDNIQSEKQYNNIIQVYPNPSKSFFTIDYQIFVPGKVILRIFDINGNVCQTHVNVYQSTGLYSVEINASSFGNGLYFCSLEVEGLPSELKKLIVIH